MSIIRAVYNQEPNFPATDQHPNAIRYIVSPYVVDAIGGVPTLEEIQAMLTRQPDNAVAFVSRQRDTTLDALDSAISSLPAAQQGAFRLIHQLLKG